jgi:hypothetical protein
MDSSWFSGLLDSERGNARCGLIDLDEGYQLSAVSFQPDNNGALCLADGRKPTADSPKFVAPHWGVESGSWQGAKASGAPKMAGNVKFLAHKGLQRKN